MTLQLPREKWENLPGGLANAIKQAKEREFEKMFIFDSDCHQSEPYRAMAKYVDDPLRNLLLSPDPEEDPFEARLARMYKGAYRDDQFYMAGVKLLKRPETSLTIDNWQGVDELIRIHTELMHDIGIQGSIILPSPMLGLAMGSPKTEVTVANAYINYMLDNFLGKYPEMNTLIYVPTQSPDKAAELIDKVGSEKGVRGIMVTAASKVNAGSDSMDPIYEACTGKGLPVCVHGHRNSAAADMKFLGEHALTFPMSLIRHLTSVILNGVSVRYPKLKFVFMEGGVTWIPWIRARLDDEYMKRRIEAPLLTKLPSEYMKEFYYTSQPLEQSHMEVLPPIFEMMDFENHLLYASDYPHWDFDVPSVIYDLPFLSETAKKKILGENARQLFKLGN
jgi:predicted TIM-barrel fold metal-dependent hydrolase